MLCSDVLLFRIPFTRKEKFHCILLTIFQQQQPPHSSQWKKNAKKFVWNDERHSWQIVIRRIFICAQNTLAYTRNAVCHSYCVRSVFVQLEFLFHSEESSAKQRMTHMKSPIQMRNTKQMSIKSQKKRENISGCRSLCIHTKAKRKTAAPISNNCWCLSIPNTIPHTGSHLHYCSCSTWSRHVNLWSSCVCVWLCVWCHSRNTSRRRRRHSNYIR